MFDDGAGAMGCHRLRVGIGRFADAYRERQPSNICGASGPLTISSVIQSNIA